jgi:hypothetical protein
MIVRHLSAHHRSRAVLRAGALALLSIGLVACSGAANQGSPAAHSVPPAVTGAPSQAAVATGQPAALATSSTRPTGAIDACALITEKEAAAFLGSDPGPGTNSGTPEAPACAYGASLTIGVGLTDAKAQFDLQRPAAGSSNFQALSGVGDDAYATLVANTVAAMEILKGSVLLSVQVQGDPSLQNVTFDALTKLGKTAAGRI